jgi:hypothetical protein
MNIAFAKMGKSIKFCRSTWSGAGGDCEGPMLVEILANKSPDNTIFLFGRNDLDKFKKLHEDEYKKAFPHQNVVNLFEGLAVKTGQEEVVADEVIKRFNAANIDEGIINMGPHGQTHFQNLIKKKNGDGTYCKTLECFRKYAFPTIKVLNDCCGDIPMKWILNDPRYTMRAYDLFYDRYPDSYLAQYDGEKRNTGSISTYEDGETRNFTFHTAKLKYTAVETIWLYGKQAYDISNLEEDIKQKENKLRIVLNQGKSSGGLDRHPLLLEYIGEYGSDDYIEDVEVYGKWDKEILATDPRFKGPKNYEELGELMSTAKCTFAIPIKRGWATSKWCECMHGFKDGFPGLVTFIHPWYDEQKHVFKEGTIIDRFLRVTPQDFRKRVKALFENEDVYKQILTEQYSLLKPEFYSGDYLFKLLTK